MSQRQHDTSNGGCIHTPRWVDKLTKLFKKNIVPAPPADASQTVASSGGYESPPATSAEVASLASEVGKLSLGVSLQVNKDSAGDSGQSVRLKKLHARAIVRKLEATDSLIREASESGEGRWENGIDDYAWHLLRGGTPLNNGPTLDELYEGARYCRQPNELFSDNTLAALLSSSAKEGAWHHDYG